MFLTWRLTKTRQKPFLQNFHVVIKIHLPRPLEYKVMVSSIKRETTLLLHDTGKNKLKVFTWKTITPPFSKILLVARFTLLWHHDGQARQPLSRVYGPSLLLRRFVFRMAEASAKQVTGDEPQGTMGRVQTAGEAHCLLLAFLCARNFIKRETSGYEAGRNPFKLNGSDRSNKKSFEKTGPPFEVDHFSRSGRLEFWLNGSRPDSFLVFPKFVHILGMLVLYRPILMVCGREGTGVEFKVCLMSQQSRESTCKWCNNHCSIRKHT